MASFVLNSHTQANGDNEVHNRTTGCICMPLIEHQLDLGEHADCHGAIAHARQKWPDASINGCAFCCNACHTG